MDFRELAAIGAEPTPSAVAPVIVRILEQAGGCSRANVIADVEAEWLSAGGYSIPKPKTLMRVKKALAMLQEQGIIENPTYGFYRLKDTDATIAPVPNKSTSEAVVATPGDETEFDEVDEGHAPEREIGIGPQSVYAFYLPAYRRAAEQDGANRWPVKIGMTTSSVAIRMATHQTALPEIPCVALVINCDNAALLEKVLHGVLTLRGQRSDEAGGSEWFITNIDELVDIFEQVVGAGSPGDSGAGS